MVLAKIGILGLYTLRLQLPTCSSSSKNPGICKWLSTGHKERYFRCREKVSVQRSTIICLIKNQKHVSGKERLLQKVKLERDLAEALCTYDDRYHPKGETLSMESRIFRVKIVTAFLKAGVAINKINCFWSILEESSYRLISWSHVSCFFLLFGGKRRKPNRKNSTEERFPLCLMAQPA